MTTYHAPSVQCAGCKVSSVRVVHGHLDSQWHTWMVQMRDMDGAVLANIPCAREDEARTVAALARQAHGVRDDEVTP